MASRRSLSIRRASVMCCIAIEKFTSNFNDLSPKSVNRTKGAGFTATRGCNWTAASRLSLMSATGSPRSTLTVTEDQTRLSDSVRLLTLPPNNLLLGTVISTFVSVRTRVLRVPMRSTVTAILAATVVSTSGFLVVMIFPERVIALFSRNDPALQQLGTHAMRTCLLMLPIVGFQIVSANYFQAVGKPWKAMLLTLSRQVLLLIPAVLVLPHLFRLNGLWAAFPAADLGSSLWTGAWLLVELRYLRNRSHASRPTPDAA